MKPLPLTGVRVLDLTNVIAGPVATRMLSHLGAEVIKIEIPWGRGVGNIAMFTSDKSVERPYNKHAGFNEVNRAKKSLALDLADSRGKGIFKELVSVSDVVIENYSPRVMPNLGLDYEQLRTLRPDLIMVAMPALGRPGPWSDYVSFGPGTEGLGGMCHVTGYEDGPPSKPGNFYSDQTSAFHVATAIMAAIWKRRRTGEGKRLEIVLRDVTMAVIGEKFLEYQLTGRGPGRVGNRHHGMAPHNVYRCKGEDAWVVIAVASDEEFAKLAETTSNPGWVTDTRFASMAARLQNQDTLDGLIKMWTLQHTPQEAMYCLQASGVRAGAVLKAPETLTDPQYEARGFVDHTHHPEGGDFKHPGVSFRSSGPITSLGRRAPLFAEHSDWAIGGLLGHPASTAEILHNEGVAPLVPVTRK